MQKLIYYTVGNNPDYINLVKMSIDSLLDQGYNGDILFITEFDDLIKSKITFRKEPLFLKVESSDLILSSANKLKIYKYDKIQKYDKIIFCDSDIIWTKNPDSIFDLINEDLFYVSNEDSLMASDVWWGSTLLNEKEKADIILNQVKGINAGIFGFNQAMIGRVKEIDLFFMEDQNLWNYALEQPFFNAYLYRNSIYSNSINSKVKHCLSDFVKEPNDWSLIHFLGGPGGYAPKFERMSTFIRNRSIKVFKTRDDMVESYCQAMKICEIGIFKGDFTKIILDKLNPKELHLIDMFEGVECSGDKDGNNVVWTDLSVEYKRLQKLYENIQSVYLHKGLSHSVLEKFADNYFDCVYIDGDHSYDGVKADLEISLRVLRDGGFIMGHDYLINPEKTQNYYNFGVKRAVDEFCLTYNQQICALAMDGCVSFCIHVNKMNLN
jgi:hypothetical protein